IVANPSSFPVVGDSVDIRTQYSCDAGYRDIVSVGVSTSTSPYWTSCAANICTSSGGYPAVQRCVENWNNGVNHNTTVTTIKYTATDTTKPPTFPPPLTLPEIIDPSQAHLVAEALAAAAAGSPTVRANIDNNVKARPDLLSSPAAITPEQVQQYAQDAAQKAIDERISELEAAVAANPTDTALASELSKAKAEEAIRNADQVAEQAEKPPEPNYPVPSSWYTPTCNIANGLASCINYQQVLDASSAFENTAPYQITNLVLECLGFIKGNGCTYPPTVSVAFPNYFTSAPITFDLSPFSSVVNIMKFFFSLLCMVATGKLVMNLFA
ncbi:MAG: cell envelope integrity protein TolA, partial [Chlorobium sp.]|nr:cell envelope integrity protein TolA [Chlorobium sp.]